MKNKRFKNKLIISVLLVLAVISGLLIAIYHERVRCNLLDDQEAVRIAKDFCDKFHLECTGNPETDYYTNDRLWSNLKCRPNHFLYNKAIIFDTGEIHVGCKSKKVLSAYMYPGYDNLLSRKMDVTLQLQYDYFKEFLTYLNISQCSFVTGYTYSPESGAQDINMWSIIEIDEGTANLSGSQILSEKLRLLNTGGLSLETSSDVNTFGLDNPSKCDGVKLSAPFKGLEASSKKIHLDLAGPPECKGYELANSFKKHISITEADSIAINALKEQGFGENNYKLRAIDLVDIQEHGIYRILDKTWNATFERTVKNTSLPNYITVRINALNRQVISTEKLDKARFK